MLVYSQILGFGRMGGAFFTLSIKIADINKKAPALFFPQKQMPFK